MGDRLKQNITVLMSQTIVYMLEIIQIQIEKGALAVIELCLLDEMRKIPLTAHPVVKTCEEIIVCLLLYLLLIQLLSVISNIEHRSTLRPSTHLIYVVLRSYQRLFC